MKIVFWSATVVAIAIAIMAGVAGLLSYFVGQVSPTFGLPILGWWKSFCLLWIVSIIGATFGGSHAAATKPK